MVVITEINLTFNFLFQETFQRAVVSACEALLFACSCADVVPASVGAESLVSAPVVDGALDGALDGVTGTAVLSAIASAGTDVLCACTAGMTTGSEAIASYAGGRSSLAGMSMLVTEPSSKPGFTLSVADMVAS